MIRTVTTIVVLVIGPRAALAQTRAQPPAKPSTPPAARQSAAAELVLAAPAWLKDHRFSQTTFTLVRVQYDSANHQGSWATDFPDADLNLVDQVGRLTKLDVSQPSRVLRLTDEAIANYPLLYLSEPSAWSIRQKEVVALRRYLDAGGFLWVDDFWGEAEWEHVRAIMKQVFPDRETVDLPLTHPLFHAVFDLQEKPQVLSIHAFLAGHKTERRDALEVHYRAMHDDRGRIVVLLCHNTDLADGWERIGEEVRYTREMSLARAFPMGINILYFALMQPPKHATKP